MRSGSVRVLALAATITAGALAACSDSTSPQSRSVSLSFSGIRPPGVAPVVGGVMSVENILADTLVQASGSDTLKITGAWVVLRRVSLERVEASTANCDTMPEGSGECEDFTLRDVLVPLPLAAGVQTSVSVTVDTGTFGSVHFKIHRPGTDSIDAAFKAANPGFDTVSVKVTGLFNGTPFTFVSRLDAEQEYDFSPPLVVTSGGGMTNLTIRMDLTSWFKNGVSGALINPTTANPGGANESLVNQNIKNSVKAFEDDNRDGDERNR